MACVHTIDPYMSHTLSKDTSPEGRELSEALSNPKIGRPNRNAHTPIEAHGRSFKPFDLHRSQPYHIE